MQPKEIQLSSVHDALQAAVLEDKRQDDPLVPISLKAPRNVKADVEEICKRNGTTLSSFLRKCMVALRDDYRA